MENENKRQIQNKAKFTKAIFNLPIALLAICVVEVIGSVWLEDLDIKTALLLSLIFIIPAALIALYGFIYLKTCKVYFTDKQFGGKNFFGSVQVSLDKITKVYKKQRGAQNSKDIGTLVVVVGDKTYKYKYVSCIDSFIADLFKARESYKKMLAGTEVK
jgi:hypothetical protein